MLNSSQEQQMEGTSLSTIKKIYVAYGQWVGGARTILSAEASLPAGFVSSDFLQGVTLNFNHRFLLFFFCGSESTNLKSEIYEVQWTTVRDLVSCDIETSIWFREGIHWTINQEVSFVSSGISQQSRQGCPTLSEKGQSACRFLL